MEHARTVLTADEMAYALTRMTHEILERNHGADGVTLLGILTRGAPLAQRIADIAAQQGHTLPVGRLDITMYRDDLAMHPARALGPTEIPTGGIDGKIVVLVDDVLFSGRTVRAALDAIHDVGRPRAVRLAVIVDRGHRELPIRADHVGKNLPTHKGESVRMRLTEIDGVDEIVLIREEEGS